MKTAGLYLMALIYIGAGINHFISPDTYLKIMPPYLPAPEILVAVSGVAEAALGAALFWPRTRRWAAWGLIALLIAVFPANLYMWQQRETQFAELPSWALLARLPAQLLLIWWAYSYTRNRSTPGAPFESTARP